MTADETLPLEESHELALMRDSVRGTLEALWPVARAVQLAADPGSLAALWRTAAAQGWTALSASDDELGLAAAIVALQEMGRASCPVPLLDAALANAVLGASQSQAARELMAQVHAGEAVPAWVFPEDGRTFRNGFTVGRTLEGTIEFVEHGAIATHFLLPTGRPGEFAIVARDAAGLRLTPTPGLNVPALSKLAFSRVDNFQLATSSFDFGLLVPLGRLLLAARATGAAQRGLEELTEYAKLRSQFGRRIGEYQAIQHKLVDCLTQVEICRLSQLAAGRAAPDLRGYRAGVAAANACGALRKVVLELHHGFGGISFWSEHEMPRHFLRVHGDLTRLGGVRAARAEVATALLELGAVPGIPLSPRADDFRAEVRAWLAGNWDGTYPREAYALPVNHRKARQDFSRKLGAKGWLGITWPRAYGGQGRSALELLAFEEELAYHEAPLAFHSPAVNMIAPALIAHASDAQKSRFLPAIARGDVGFALGYTEPDHGSDLAGIKTAATRTPDGGWTIRGQKIFTSNAGFSTHVWLAARTDPERPRHGGISVFAIPLDTPGITIHPLLGLNGHRSNIVFYDDVKVPADALVGQENGGWKVIVDALAYERVTLGAIAARARSYFDRLLRHVRSQPGLRDDAVVVERLGELGAEIEAARLLAIRAAQVMEQGQVPLWEAAMLKVHSSELMERLSESAFELLGSASTLFESSEGAVCDGVFEYGVRDALLYTIGGGTNEIQRNLIAQRALGLPRS